MTVGTQLVEAYVGCHSGRERVRTYILVDVEAQAPVLNFKILNTKTPLVFRSTDDIPFG